MKNRANLIVGIHEGLNRSRPMSLRRYEVVLRYNNIAFAWLNASHSEFWEYCRKIDYFIFRFSQYHSDLQIAQAILPIIETHLRIRCFPDQNTCWHYDDKIKQYYLLKAYGFPVVDTWIFWDKLSAWEFVSNAKFPIVFKLRGGAGSANVGLIGSRKSAQRVINKMFSNKGVVSNKIPLKNNLHRNQNLLTLYPIRRYIAHKRGRTGPAGMYPYWQTQRDYVIFQKFLPRNEYDTRITVIGDRAFAFRRYNRPDDFRASGSGQIDYDISKIDKNSVKLCFEISQKLKFQSMAYDLLYDESRNIRVVEISYTFVDEAVYNCPGYFDRSMNFHEGHFWPQFCQLQDLIRGIHLQCPQENIMRG